jgi:uncharacterized membrane protein
MMFNEPWFMSQGFSRIYRCLVIQLASNAQLKNLSKNQLRGKFPPAMLICFFAASLEYMALLLLSALPTNTMSGLMTFLLCSLLVQTICGVTQVGICLYFLCLVTEKPALVSCVLLGFREQTNKCLFFSFLYSLIRFICYSPFEICVYLFLINLNSRWIGNILVALLIGTLVYVPLQILLSQSFYILLDFPNLTISQTLRRSLNVIKGKQLRVFLLELSLFPLTCLELFSLRIGSLWVMPYKETVRANLYLNLMRRGDATSKTQS